MQMFVVVSQNLFIAVSMRGFYTKQQDLELKYVNVIVILTTEHVFNVKAKTTMSPVAEQGEHSIFQ